MRGVDDARDRAGVFRATRIPSSTVNLRFPSRSLSRLWPLWLFFAAFVLAMLVFAPAWSQRLVLQGPDGYPNLTHPGLWRRAAEWICRGNPCLEQESLVRVLLPPLAGHELFYAVSAGVVALGIGLYLRLLGLPLAACFGGGLAMAFSGYHFTLFNAGHRGYAGMVGWAALMLPLVRPGRPSPCWASARSAASRCSRT